MRDNWEMVRLGDVCDISAGQGAPQGDDMYCKVGGKPFIKAGNLEWLSSGGGLDTIQHVSDEVVKSHKLHLYPKGSIVFAKSGMSCKKSFIYILDMDCYIVSHLACLTPKKVHSDFLKYYLQAHPPSGLIKNESYPSIKLSDISEIQLPLPPLAEQKRIAAALDKMSSMISKRKRQIELLDEAAKSLFVEMFGDPVENPMGWDVDVLNNLGEIISGITKGRKTIGKTLADIPYMRVANVKDGHLDLSEIKLIGATADEIKKYALQKGDVLLTEGGDNDKLGRGALWKGEIEPCIHQNHIFRVRVYSKKMIPEYFAEYIKSSQAKLYFLKSAKQTTGIASINMRQLSALPVVLPPLLLQGKFVERIGKLEQQKMSCERGLSEMETAFSAMMQGYFG